MAIALQPPGKRHRDDDFYPASDGKPMAETEKHRKLMTYCIESLEIFFADRADVQVSGNNFIYFEEGNPNARISPDCYVVFGVPKRVRDSYFVWREGGHVPSVVFEFTSKKTRKEDVTKKGPLYEQELRVAEYFRFDPTGDYLKPRLQGQRLEEGHYVSIPLIENRLHSEVLGLDLVMAGEDLRIYDGVKDEWLLSSQEMSHQLEAERFRSELETRRAESEATARLIAEQRADQEMQRAETAEQRAKQEAQRAETAEAELARLRAELASLRGQEPGT